MNEPRERGRRPPGGGWESPLETPLEAGYAPFPRRTRKRLRRVPRERVTRVTYRGPHTVWRGVVVAAQGLRARVRQSE